MPVVPLSINDVLAGDPALKYGPSVWVGVNAVGHVPVAATAGLPLAAEDGVLVVDAVAGGQPQAERARTAENDIAQTFISQSLEPNDYADDAAGERSSDSSSAL